MATTTDALTAWGRRARQASSLWLALATWAVVAAGIGEWILQAQRHQYRQETLKTAEVRLAGVKDTLSITLRQLAALPQNVAHRLSIIEFMRQAATAPPSETARSAVRTSLDYIATDFALPLVALVDVAGNVLATTVPAPAGVTDQAASIVKRGYFQQAMRKGAAMEFRLGRLSQVPGVYFANRVDDGGRPLGVVIAKQETETLNRLLSDADGSLIFVSDVNGVVVLANQPRLLLQRLPDATPPAHVDWQQIYQREPAVLPWQSQRTSESGRAALLTQVGSTPHLSVASALGEAPFKVWVLSPLDDEPAIVRGVWGGTAAVWLGGMLLIWLSWRLMQLLDVAVKAQRDLLELTQALPLTVFRYRQPAKGAPSFTFLGRGVEELFGVDKHAIEADPLLPWRLADGSDRPPLKPREFVVRRGETASWLLADSSAQLEADGSTTYNGYWLDVSARRVTQARLAAVFEHASASYLFFDAKNGISHCNPATLALFGTEDARRLVGRSPWLPDLSPETQPNGMPSRQKALEGMHEHLRSRARVQAVDWRFRRADGSEFDAEVSIIALEWEGTPQFCAVIQDITARKQITAAMQRAREAAESASQTKSTFLANMSHELRTPMNAIIGMTHLALEDGLPDKQRDYIEKAHGAARNLLQILNDILDVSKIEAGQLALERIDFELEAVIADTADVLGLKAEEKGLELLFSGAPDLPRRLVGDPTRLRQVLVNLGGNAIKFTERGEVTIGMEVTGESADGIELHGWVRDTGSGIPPEQINNLFQPFSQGDASTTRRFGGTGLGLVISRQLLERMGGSLWVDSTPGTGSTFHFSARFGRSTPRAPARAWMAHELRGQRALIIDDNAAALSVLARMVEMLGIEADVASSGAEGLALMASRPNSHAWVLIDWKMPEMDGVECARRVFGEANARPPGVLLLTAFNRDDAVRAAGDLPLAGVLSKPITPSMLQDSLVQSQRRESRAPVPARRIGAVPEAVSELRSRLEGSRVLLVEDHALNQELACELLRRAGVDVVVADNGQDALQRLEDAGPFDAVLMDCQMPVMDGYSTTRAMRADPRWHDLPVIAMTASALVEDRDRALESGMNAHVTKPIHVDLMLRTLADWVAEPSRRARRQLAALGRPAADRAHSEESVAPVAPAEPADPVAPADRVAKAESVVPVAPVAPPAVTHAMSAPDATTVAAPAGAAARANSGDAPVSAGSAGSPAAHTPSAPAAADVPAVDVASGLARCMGNRDLHRRLLIGFRDAETGFPDRLRAALSAADWRRAAGSAHDLKGLAGTVGANDLQAAAQLLHKAVSDRDTERTLGELERVETELRRALGEIGTLIAARDDGD